jgi:hypothetical protein
MTFTEVQQEIRGWEPALQRRLMAYLATLEFQREGVDGEEIARRLNDRTPENWITLPDARNKLLGDS